MTRWVPHQSLIEDLTRILSGFGADRRQAAVVCEALVWSDLIGRATHGVWRFPAYIKRYQAGLLKCPCNPKVQITGPATARIEGDQGFGHYVAFRAMEHAIRQAGEAGVSLVTVRESNHFGAAGYYANMAAESEMLGIVLSNSIAKVAPAGGVRPVFGTNPFAFATPRRQARPIILDMATSSVSGGRVIRAKDSGELLPEGVLVAPDGTFITDPLLADHGVMLPFGGAKGAGLALLVELLSGVIAGASLSTEVRSMFNDFSGSGNNGHCFIAVDLRRLLPMDAYYDNLDRLVVSIKRSSGEGGKEVRLPGEVRWKTLEERTRRGVPLEDELVEQLLALALAADVDTDGLLEDSELGGPD